MDMMKKMDVRKKAVMASMKDGSGLEAIMKKKMAPEMGMDEQAEEGFVQMMVSPEEKQMILEMRSGVGGGEEEMEF